MSKENMKKFFEALAQDAALAGELDARIAALTIAFAAEKGFEFTAEEYAELSDEDLDNVNGGLALASCMKPVSGRSEPRSRTC